MTESIKQLLEEGYGRYWCSTDKKWKTRKGPKQTRSTKESIEENFADGKNPGRKGLAKRVGVNTKASVSDLRKTAKNSTGEKQRMAHWMANMKAGKAKAESVDGGVSLVEEFDRIELFVETLAEQHGVDAEVVWEDFEALDDDELFSLSEDWQKTNKKDRTDGMSRKAVKAYRRENPGSKLQTAVTTKPSKLKKGSKASKRRKSYCSRSAGQKRMHNIDCSKTPDKAICKARRRWNC